MKTQHIAIAGSSGKMGRALLEEVAQSADFRLKAALERSDSAYIGKDAGEIIAAVYACKVVLALCDTPLIYAARAVLVRFLGLDATRA